MITRDEEIKGKEKSEKREIKKTVGMNGIKE